MGNHFTGKILFINYLFYIYFLTNKINIKDYHKKKKKNNYHNNNRYKNNNLKFKKLILYNKL
jgi:hypothetical protein